MARIREWADLAELGDMASLIAAGWIQQGSASISSVVTSPFHDAAGNGGAYSIELRPNGGTNAILMSPTLSTPVSTFYLRHHFNVNTLGSQQLDSYILAWYKNGTELGSLRLSNVTGTVGQLKLFSGGSQIAISTNVLAVNTWYTIEVGITIGNTGAYEVRVNGTSIGWIPPGVGDTQPGADTNVNTYSINSSDSGGIPIHFFDDGAADDAVFCGESLITALAPNGAGATTQLTPTGSATNWQNVDEIPPSDTDFNAAVSPNQKDTYAHAALPGTAFTIKNVVVAARVVRIGTTIASGYIVSRSGGSDTEAAAQPVGLSASIITAQFENDPATSAPWTVSHLNSSEIGIRFDT